jgi:hypothetical protein
VKTPSREWTDWSGIGDPMEAKPTSRQVGGAGEHCGVREDRRWSRQLNGCAMILA